MLANPLLSSVNAGELSPRMIARVDFERYPSGATLLRNMILFPQGGISRRPGTRFVKAVKDSTRSTILIPFVFSQDDSYMIEMGDLYIRLYRRQGRIDVVDISAAITNGTFTSNITGWTNRSTGGSSITHDSTNGRLQLTGATSGFAWAEQSVSIGSGNTAKVHVLKFRIAGFGGGQVGLQIGTSTVTANVLAETLLGIGEHSIEFTPGASTVFIQFRQKNDPVRNMFIDNVSLIDNAPMEVVSPYTSAEAVELRTSQAGDVVYLLHPDHPIRRVERRGDRSWSIVQAFFEDGPYLSINDGTDIDAAQLFENPLFLNGIIGWTNASANDGYIEHNQEGSFAELDPGTLAALGNAILRSSCTTISGDKHVVHVLLIGAGPVNVKFGTAAGGSTYINTTQNPGWVSYEFTTTGTALHVEFSYAEYDQNRAAVGGCLAYNENARLLEPSAATGTITLNALGFSPFASTDVGRLIRLTWAGREPGYGVVTAFSSSTSITLLVLRKLADVTPTEDWQFGAWGGTQGYPHTMSFFDGRAAIANTPEKPRTMWLSQSGDLQNMRPDSFVDGSAIVEDDDAIDKTLESTQIDPIVWMNGQRQLLTGTAGGQWVVDSSGSVITPADSSAKQHTAVPAADIHHVPVNQITIFADKSRREVYDIGFRFEDNSFVATDLTILADHIFRSPVADFEFQRRPYSVIWARRDDGRLAPLSYNRQHDVLGWSQAILGGVFGSGDAVVESIAVIPGAEDSNQQYNSDERDELWMIVKRTINGSTVRYIEFMEYFFDGPLREDYENENDWRDAMLAAQEDAFYVDCGLTYDSTPATTITGLSHLQGQTVKILADGKVVPDKTVSVSGSVTLPAAASKVHIGLAYKHRYESLKIAVGAAAGTSVNKVKIITGVGMVLLDTAPFKVATVDYDRFGRTQHTLYTMELQPDGGDPSDAVPLYTGEHMTPTPGSFSGDARLYCEGDAPLPFTLLGLAPLVQTQDKAPASR